MRDTSGSSTAQDNSGLVLLILILLAFLAVALLFFSTGWLTVDIGMVGPTLLG